MLRAGMMAAGQMDVDRRVERNARLAPARDLLGVTLGVGGGELAAGIAGAGDETGADGIGVMARPSASMRSCATGSFSVGTPEISRFCQTVSRRSPSPSVARDRRQGRASARPTCARPARRRRSSSGPPASARERRYARCGRNAGRGATAPGTARSSLRPSFSSTRADEFLDAHGVEHVFQPRLGAVGAIAVIDEDAHHRVRHPAGVLRLAPARRCRGRNRDGR